VSVTQLVRIAFVSERCKSLTDSDVVDEIVLPAMSKNRRLDVTGCLWFNRGHFLQFLEGPDAVVTGLLDTIMGDVRHSETRVFAHACIDERSFGRFGMRHHACGESHRLGDMVAELSRPASTHSLSPAILEGLASKCIRSLVVT